MIYQCILFAVIAAESGSTLRNSWDDDYCNALNDFSAMGPVAAHYAELLSTSLVDWKEYPAHRELRLAAQTIQPRSEFEIRIEVGGIGDLGYGGVWVASGSDGVHALVADTWDSAVCLDVSEHAVHSLETWAVANEVWSLLSDGDLAVDDGTVSFVSVRYGDRSGQFVIYAPVLGTVMTSEHREAFFNRTRIHDELIRRVLSATGLDGRRQANSRVLERSQ